ncbi:MAG: helix-turn-helix domain-containing protein [Bacteroidaceae bacterium]
MNSNITDNTDIQLPAFNRLYKFNNELYVAFDIDPQKQPDTPSAHSGHYVTFCLCHKGNATVRVNNYTRKLSPGSQLIIIPNTETMLLEATKDFNCSFISASPYFCNEPNYTNKFPLVDALLFFKEQSVINLSSDQQDFFLKMRDLIVSAITEIDNNYKKTLLVQLLQSFLTWQQITIATMLNSWPITKNSNEILATRFVSLVINHFKKQHRLEYYAGLMCITPKYLSTIVKNVTGKTAGQWINHFIIKESKKLLADSNMSVAEITDALGFSNQSFFGKFFKHHTGKSPLAFRLNK